MTDTQLQRVERDLYLEQAPQLPYNWMYDGTFCEQKPFLMQITCRSLFVICKDSGEVDVAKANIYVDDVLVRTYDPHEVDWLHTNALLLFNGQESAAHRVRVEIVPEDLDKKCTILGFGYVE